MVAMAQRPGFDEPSLKLGLSSKPGPISSGRTGTKIDADGVLQWTRSISAGEMLRINMYYDLPIICEVRHEQAPAALDARPGQAHVNWSATLRFCRKYGDTISFPSPKTR